MTMRTLAVLLEKEFRQFFRNPFLPKMAVAFPMMVMLVIPWITTMDVRHVGVSVVDNDRSTASRRLVGKIGASDYFRLYGVTEHYGASLAALERGDVDVIVEIPDDFERSIAERSPRRVSITANGVNALKGSLGSQYMVQTVMGTLAELLAEEGVAPSPDLITVQNRYNPTPSSRCPHGRSGSPGSCRPATSSASCGRFTSRGRPSPISGPTMRLSRSSPCCSTSGRR